MQLLSWKKVQETLGAFRRKPPKDPPKDPQPGQVIHVESSPSITASEGPKLVRIPMKELRFRQLLWEIHLHLTEPSVIANLVSDHLRKGRVLGSRLEKLLTSVMDDPQRERRAFPTLCPKCSLWWPRPPDMDTKVCKKCRTMTGSEKNP